MKQIGWVFRLAIALVIGVVIAFGISRVMHPPSTVHEVTKTDLEDAKKLAKTVKVSEKAATQIQREIVRVREPVEVYYASSTKAVQNYEETHRKENKADRVVVSPNEEDQKVDVYRITLKKEHKIKAGVTVLENKVYPTVGYQAGKFEGLVHLNGTNVKGASVMYTVHEW